MGRRVELAWDEQTHGTGIPEVDEQHRRLFVEVHALGAVCDAQPLARAEVRRIMQFLWEYTAIHFNTEERYLGASPRDQAHFQSHRRFVKKLDLSRRALESTSCSRERCQDLQRWLSAWLLSHVGGEDRALLGRGQAAPQTWFGQLKSSLWA